MSWILKLSNEISEDWTDNTSFVHTDNIAYLYDKVAFYKFSLLRQCLWQ